MTKTDATRGERKRHTHKHRVKKKIVTRGMKWKLIVLCLNPVSLATTKTERKNIVVEVFRKDLMKMKSHKKNPVNETALHGRRIFWESEGIRCAHIYSTDTQNWWRKCSKGSKGQSSRKALRFSYFSCPHIHTWTNTQTHSTSNRARTRKRHAQVRPRKINLNDEDDILWWPSINLCFDFLSCTK